MEGEWIQCGRGITLVMFTQSKVEDPGQGKEERNTLIKGSEADLRHLRFDDNHGLSLKCQRGITRFSYNNEDSTTKAAHTK